MSVNDMAAEEEFIVDLQGYIVIQNVLDLDVVGELNRIIDQGDRQGKTSLWGEPFKKLIGHPRIFLYLLATAGGLWAL